MGESLSITQTPYVTDHAPTVGGRLAVLKPGADVILVRDGREHLVTVQRFSQDGSSDHARLTVGYGPGRWNTEVTAARILGGFEDLRLPVTA